MPGGKGDWPTYGAAYGKVPSKKQTIYGYKLHLLITLEGLILDFELAPANAGDLAAGFELLSQHTDLTVLGDKAYISAAKAADLWQNNRIRLLTLPRRTQKTQLPSAPPQQFILCCFSLHRQSEQPNRWLRQPACCRWWQCW